MKLLNNGLQYNIEQPPWKYWTNLIMETEQAIKLMDAKMQNPLRILAAKKTVTNFHFWQPPKCHAQTTDIYYKKHK